MRNINDEDYIRKTFQARTGTCKDYMLEYVIGSQRNVLYNLANAIHAIEYDDVLMDLFHFNLSQNREMMKTNKGFVPVDDRIIGECQEYMQRHCGLRAIKKTDVADAIHVVSRRDSYDPLMDHLNSLIWDGIPRCDDWLIVCAGAEDNKYNREISLRMLLAMVKRAKEPGCKCDYMPVLEGKQGIGKSTICRILGGNFYSQNLPPLDSNGGKEACIHVLGYWIIEAEEMHVFTRTTTESSHMKAFISRTHERFRGINARKEEQTPRRCFFIGTTNREQYLRDETGQERRFWPVICRATKDGKVDLDWLERNRDQLLAEALQRVRDGEEIYPDHQFEADYIAPEQAKRREVDELHNLMADYCNSLLTRETTGANAWRFIKNDPGAVPSKQDQMRVAQSFRDLGWVKRGRGGKNVWIKE
jgi:predicted P-loop ATPase